MQTILVSDQLTMPAFTPENSTPPSVPKSLPVIVTEVPMGPWSGERTEM